MYLNDDREEHHAEVFLDNLGLVDFSIQTPTFRDITNIITYIISLYSTECTQTVGTVESRTGILAQA